MKFPGTKRARRWTKWVTNPAWQPRRSAGGSESLDDWMVESLQRWRDWKNPWKTFSTPWSSLVWMSRTGELVDYGGLWWTGMNSDSSLFEHPIKLDNKPVRHLMVSGITNGGTQHPSILPIFSAHCIPLLVGESSQLCTHCFGWPIPLVFGRTNVVRIFRSFYYIWNFIGCAPTTWQHMTTIHVT